MAENSNIEWCTHTFNPWRGCTKVSAGCKNCYADTLSARNPTTLGTWGPYGTRIVASHSMWREPLKWNDIVTDQRQRVFCASLCDVFEDWTMELRYPAKLQEGEAYTHTIAWWNPDKGIIKAGQTNAHVWHDEERLAKMQDARQQLFRLIYETPNLDWLLLTKRPENVRRMVPETWLEEGEWPHNVWIGTSVEDQNTADTRIPELLKIPAKVRFLSCEPLLGPVDISWSFPQNDPVLQATMLTKPQEGVNWVIAGGESGPQARPMHPEWARSLRDQCAAAGVPFLFKQWGNYAPVCGFYGNAIDEVDTDGTIALEQSGCIVPEQDDRYLHQPDDSAWLMKNVGKKAAGRLLDGVEHNGYPTANP